MTGASFDCAVAWVWGAGAGVGQYGGGGLAGCVGGVFVVDGDAGEQGAVEDASFGGVALGVEVVEVDQEFGELVQACSGLGVGVGVGGVVESCGDLVEAGADAVLFVLEEVEGDRVGVVGLDEFEAFGFGPVSLGFRSGSCVDRCVRSRLRRVRRGLRSGCSWWSCGVVRSR